MNEWYIMIIDNNVCNVIFYKRLIKTRVTNDKITYKKKDFVNLLLSDDGTPRPNFFITLGLIPTFFHSSTL